MYAVSNEPSYVEVINQNLERLLVFETVFKEYVHTCKNIEKGNCYASESLDRLRLYFTKNVIKFCNFVDSVNAESAPCNYAAFHKVLVKWSLWHSQRRFEYVAGDRHGSGRS